MYDCAELAKKLGVKKIVAMAGLPAGNETDTTRESERLARLPMYYGLTGEQVDYICDTVKKFYA